MAVTIQLKCSLPSIVTVATETDQGIALDWQDVAQGAGNYLQKE